MSEEDWGWYVDIENIYDESEDSDDEYDYYMKHYQKHTSDEYLDDYLDVVDVKSSSTFIKNAITLSSSSIIIAMIAYTVFTL